MGAEFAVMPAEYRGDLRLRVLPGRVRAADPVAAMWPAAVRWLEETPELEAKMLFEHLLADTTLAGQVDARALRSSGG